MKALLLTLLHLTVMTATLCGPGGVRAVIAEHLLLKQQLIVLRRPRQRAPHLTASDRLLFGFGALFLKPQDESERSPSAYAPRRSWYFIRRWGVARTADCSRRASARSSPDRRGRARHLSRPSSISRRVLLGSAVHGLRASSRERSGPTSTRTSCTACCRHTLAPSRAEPGPRGCRSSATRQTACGVWTSFDASPSCSGATGCSWSWTNSRAASSESACTAVRSMAPTAAACATPPCMVGAPRDISAPIMIRCSRRIVGQRTCGFWRSTQSRPCLMCPGPPHSWSA